MDKAIHEIKPSRITIVGGGFIGIEVAENLIEAGHKVALVEALPQVLSQFDIDMVQILHKELLDNGVELTVNDKVVGFEENQVILESGKKFTSEIIVMGIGVRPEGELAKRAG